MQDEELLKQIRKGECNTPDLVRLLEEPSKLYEIIKQMQNCISSVLSVSYLMYQTLNQLPDLERKRYFPIIRTQFTEYEINIFALHKGMIEDGDVNIQEFLTDMMVNQYQIEYLVNFENAFRSSKDMLLSLYPPSDI